MSKPVVDWEAKVLGSLWTVRDNVVFTYHSHYHREKVCQSQAGLLSLSSWVLASLGGAASLAAIKQLRPPALAAGAAAVITVASGVLAFVAPQLQAVLQQEASDRRLCGQQWHALYRDATQLRDDVGENPDRYAVETFDARVQEIVARKAALDANSLRTDNRAYEHVRIELNRWWYKAEKDRHRSFGWSGDRVPSG
eukprot:TRINITY_DN5592_c1_g2_i1.p1 TRINITY_DN5592_c1_g2~~TRINITY_DN5592_c1_g2_i1.p1  ORF type:complete len:196 (+),score=12.70 TRINITY_DN5592_c1_g2_i1:353-940(+)